MTQLEFLKNVTEQKKARILDANDRIHDFAELSYEEVQSADLLCEILAEEGFAVERGLAGMPTCFTGTFGSGSPVMGILGEYDALDALSQESACTVKKPLKEGAPGHGCGHCSLGTGSLLAAILVKEYLQANDLPGTVIYYGCPAEEGAGSKQFMARAGLFGACDFVYTWHPSTTNDVSANSSTAIMGGNFSFTGITAHAGGAPWLGRSALDAAELMSVGCNYLREHIMDGQRIHYAYSDAGGTAPNVVQGHAVVKYEVRAKTVAEVKLLWDRVVRVAEGAAHMTETTLDVKKTMAFSDHTNNSVLAKIASDCLQEVGAPAWDEDDFTLAKAYLNSYGPMQLESIKAAIAAEFGEEDLEAILEHPLQTKVFPYDRSKGRFMGGSTDVGDVSYAAPTCEIHVACACIGNIGHSWQMAGQAGSRIAHKGLLTAGEVMALACIRTMEDPAAIEAAKAELHKKNGGKYVCPLPDDVQPPIGTY